ncbi:hypothetical protein FE257_010082 [Aspergillus nanangensis]|uniref:Polyketide synthase n=1 Tax=Aspergillus nanangensis TaxID=2582783 RepID=A0AAD4GRJ8_ASPNN|nr:hypothetical protein FE257_010082 [Aspergillus nanangensis]
MNVSSSSEPIAVIGSACRFPGGATTPSKLWDLLRQPRDVRRQFDPEILNLHRFYNPKPGHHGSTYVKNQGYLLEEDSRVFDAGFFGITPYEADNMDPQQRVLLETVYEMMESAGYTLDQMQGTQTSVYVGSMTADYVEIQSRDPDTISQYTGTGTARSILSNRISYVFDLHGPSVTIDTACSSSLVALHQAVQGLRNGDANCAIVGGVNVILDPVEYMVLSSLQMLSPDSQSRMWDKTANGYARGEGVATIMIKPLSHAIRDNDPIEGIIRGTGVNSDGRSPGITMPTSASQAALIRDTYRRAGLDPVKDRCQYFECHGTGTMAGDPVEARAVSDAFIEDDSAEESAPLYVGSIKTLIGHLEGAAGLAGVLKVLLAMKNKTIPPNMLFQELNPDIEPYYGRLRIPTSPLPWPSVGPGHPLRASVNSFGFGGTNAHVIVESYEYPPDKTTERESYGEENDTEPISPIVLSAASGTSLMRNARALEQHLQEHPSLNLDDLTWVLRNKRSIHGARTFFSASTRDGLIARMQKFVQDHETIADADKIGVRHRRVNQEEVPGILGVFTGQGAQWPMMGRCLLEKSHLFRGVLEQCDKSLQLLPDGPKWSLLDELSKEDPSSRIYEAEISQPLCTAIQLALVELLYCSGIRFDAVVGHSSGEIAAVYACGIINLAAAMQIAYYRGKYAFMARGADGSAGAMLAVGIGYQEAKEYCQRGDNINLITVAASNSLQSVTLSGDEAAISRAEKHFKAEGAFARLLQVDTAYHSHHMERCAASYLSSLKDCDIQVHRPRDGCFWNSSVRGDTELLRGDLECLKGPYWVQNMVQGVLFSQAVKSAIWHGGPFDLAIEVGPHPALRRPTEQTLDSAFGSAPAYTGTLMRGTDDTEAVADTLGSVWAHLGPEFVNWEGYRQAFSQARKNPPQMLQGLPPYSWDHDRVHWRESRISARFRKDQDTSHELLGRRMPDDTDGEWRWRNVLKLSELPWLEDHEVSGEVVLPASAYISLAMEAARIIAGEDPVRLIEVQSVKVHRPVIVPGGRQGADTLFTVRLSQSDNPMTIRGSFSYACSPDENSRTMTNTCDGQLIIHLGEGTHNELPASGPLPRDLLPVDIDRAYQTLSDVGIRHSGIFRRLLDIRRRWDFSIGTAEWKREELGTRYLLHPAVLDISFQNLFHASAEPSTGKLPTAVVPVTIERLAVNPKASLMIDTETMRTTTESFITAREGIAFTGDLHTYNSGSGEMAVQIEGFAGKPIAPVTEEHDRHLFYDNLYYADPSIQLIEPLPSLEAVSRLKDSCLDCERAVLFYVQRALEQIQPGEERCFAWNHRLFVQTFKHWVKMVQDERHPSAQKSWLDDTSEALDGIYDKWPQQIEFEVIRTVGENLLDIFRGKISALELLLHEDRLGRLYSEGSGYPEVNKGMADVVRQISNKFPRAKYLEIGAGTGSSTEYVLNAMGKNFDTFTYTDISPGFFEKAAQRFSGYERQIIFKTLNVEKDVVPQGYSQHAYDVIIASNVLHATANMKRTLENTRSLLKPGGFLLLIETTGIETMRTGFCVGTLPGWWLGVDDGRQHHPGLSIEKWDKVLQDTGFSGLDVALHDTGNSSQQSLSFLASQAVNDTILQLRQPLDWLPELPQPDPLYIIGGKTLLVSKVVSAINRLARLAWNKQVILKDSVEEIDFARTPAQMDVLLLQELDNPVFSETVDTQRIAMLQNIFQKARNMLWVTQDRRSGNPASNMVVGMARGIRLELPHVNTQVLDIEAIGNPSSTARTIFEAFMRLQIHARTGNEPQYLWTQETELVVESDQTLITRTRPAQDLNDRYNANNRPVRRLTDGSNVAIQISRAQNKLVLTEAEQMVHQPRAGNVAIKVRFTLAIPREDGDGIYLSVGTIVDTEIYVLVVTQRNCSIVEIPKDQAININERDCSASALQRICDKVMTRMFLKPIQSTGSTLVFNASEDLAASIVEESRICDAEVLFASSGSSIRHDWIRIHPRMSARAIRELIPANIRAFIDCSPAVSECGLSIASALQSSCKIQRRYFDLWKHTGTSEIQQGLSDCYAALAADGYTANIAHGELSSGLEMLDIQCISQADPSIVNRVHMISWETTCPLSLAIQPPNISTLFDPKKTYLMVGMAGGLGLSICEWALRHGAKHLVITSRNPDIDPRWLAQAQRRGSNIQVRPMDISIKSSVESLVRDIRATLPPIGGVCNAAMVLSDSMFVDMDAERFNRTLKPKVDGSRHLDSLLSDTALEFFIMLSSSLTIMGAHGQTNYLAANMFMTGLAAQRRRRGVAASVIHVGYVTDVGYTTRLDSNRREFLAKQFVNPVSETDVHHAFAEAIFAGRPDSQRSSEIGMGIEPLTKRFKDGEYAVFLLDPRLSHYAPPSHITEGQDVTRARVDNMEEQLREVTSEAETISLILQAFSNKLQALMHLPSDKVDVNASLTQLGIDSLVAVEIRSWFLKELGIDIPVMKLLGRDSIARICTNAAKVTMTRYVDRAPDAASSVPMEHENSEGSSDNNSIQHESSNSQSRTLPDTQPSSIADTESHSTADLMTEGEPDNEQDTGKIRSACKDLDKDHCTDMELLSGAQMQYFLFSKLHSKPSGLNCVYRYEMRGNLDIERLRKALTITMQYNQVLRTCFYIRKTDNLPVQAVRATPIIRFEHIPEAIPEDVDNALEQAGCKTWSMDSGETVGVTVLSQGLDNHTLIVYLHHITMDGMGTGNFLRDLDRAYRKQPLQNLGANHIDFTRMELKEHQSPRFRSKLQYWNQEFAIPPNALPLAPMARTKTRPRTVMFCTTHIFRQIGENLISQIKRACDILQITPFHFHLAAYQIMLSQLMGVNDLCIGFMEANRDTPHARDSVGLFTDIVPIRFRVPQDTNFVQVAQNARRKAFDAMENSYVPLSMIMDSAKIPRSGSYNPLCQAVLNYRLGFPTELPLGDHRLELTGGQAAMHGHDMSLGIVERSPTDIVLELSCQDSLYDKDAASSMLDMYINVVQTVSENLDIKINQCGISTTQNASTSSVKVLGRQIDLAEVERQLLKSGSDLLSAVVVTVRDTALIAHATPAPGPTIRQDAVPRLLATLPLPHFMCPTRLVFVDTIPVTSSGEIDRTAASQLPLSTEQDVSQCSPELNQLESQLSVLWKAVLPKPAPEITPELDFFVAGGTSLGLVQLQQSIEQEIGITTSVRDLYSAPVFGQMAGWIYFQGGRGGSNEDIVV